MYVELCLLMIHLKFGECSLSESNRIYGIGANMLLNSLTHSSQFDIFHKKMISNILHRSSQDPRAKTELFII